MKTKYDYYAKTLQILKSLKEKYPKYELSTHLSTATADYEDVGGLTDRQLFDLLEKYEFDLDSNSNLIAPQSDIDRILKEGINLDSLLDEEDEDF